jgi:hypothetical protein
MMVAVKERIEFNNQNATTARRALSHLVTLVTLTFSFNN